MRPCNLMERARSGPAAKTQVGPARGSPADHDSVPSRGAAVNRNSRCARGSLRRPCVAPPCPRASRRKPSIGEAGLKATIWLLALLLLVVGGVLVAARLRWRIATARRIARLDIAGVAPRPARFSADELRGLPAPVVRYFRAVLRENQPLVCRARIAQRGDFLVRPEAGEWRPFHAVQRVATHPAGFVWDARIQMAPGLVTFVRDAFVEGRGSMSGSVLGLFPVISLEDTPEIASGALHRYLAEAVWLPTALLPSQGVAWTALDDSSARATLTVPAT